MHRECARGAAGNPRVKPVILIAVAATACASGAPRPTLRAPLDTLAFYVGNWQCTGKSFVAPDQPVEETWSARVEVEPELEGTSLHVKMIGPGDNRTEEHKGYDPATKTWHHVAVANSGFWGALVSPGWVGDHMVFSPAGGGDDPRERATFTKRNDREYSHAVSRVTDEGEQAVWEKVCRKS